MEPTTPATQVEVIWHPLGGLRVKWLNELIIGATILVWLTLVGGVIAGVGAGIAMSSFGGGVAGIPSVADTGHLSQDGVYWIDAFGDRCLATERTATDWCP